MSFYVVLALWLIIAAGLLYWFPVRAGVRTTHAAIFAGSVVAAFALGLAVRGAGAPGGAAAVPPPVAVTRAPIDVAEFRYAFSGLQIPTRAAPGSKISGSIVVENRSPVTWAAGSDAALRPGADAPVRLGFFIYDKDGHEVRQGRGLLVSDLGPGKKRRVPFAVAAPPEPGRYTLKMDMVMETVTWFEAYGNKPQTVSITVG